MPSSRTCARTLWRALAVICDSRPRSTTRGRFARCSSMRKQREQARDLTPSMSSPAIIELFAEMHARAPRACSRHAHTRTRLATRTLRHAHSQPYTHTNTRTHTRSRAHAHTELGHTCRASTLAKCGRAPHAYTVQNPESAMDIIYIYQCHLCTTSPTTHTH